MPSARLRPACWPHLAPCLYRTYQLFHLQQLAIRMPEMTCSANGSGDLSVPLTTLIDDG